MEFYQEIQRIDSEISHLHDLLNDLIEDLQPIIEYVSNRIDAQEKVVQKFIKKKIVFDKDSSIPFSVMVSALVNYAKEKGVSILRNEVEDLLKYTYLTPIKREIFVVGYSGVKLA